MFLRNGFYKEYLLSLSALSVLSINAQNPLVDRTGQYIFTFPSAGPDYIVKTPEESLFPAETEALQQPRIGFAPPGPDADPEGAAELAPPPRKPLFTGNRPFLSRLPPVPPPPKPPPPPPPPPIPSKLVRPTPPQGYINGPPIDLPPPPPPPPPPHLFLHSKGPDKNTNMSKKPPPPPPPTKQPESLKKPSAMLPGALAAPAPEGAFPAPAPEGASAAPSGTFAGPAPEYGPPSYYVALQQTEYVYPTTDSAPSPDQQAQFAPAPIPNSGYAILPASFNTSHLSHRSSDDPDTTYDTVGEYYFSYETPEGSKRVEQGSHPRYEDGIRSLLVKGFYSYTSPEGKPIQVNYKADRQGFRPENVI